MRGAKKNLFALELKGQEEFMSNVGQGMRGHGLF